MVTGRAWSSGLKANQETNRNKLTVSPVSAGSFSFYPEDGDPVQLKRQASLTRALTQKTVLLAPTALKTSDPAQRPTYICNPMQQINLGSLLTCSKQINSLSH